MPRSQSPSALQCRKKCPPFDAGRDDKTGKRKTQFVTFRGNKRQAQTKLAELIAAVAQEKYVEPSKVTVAQYVWDRVDRWESAADISARTAARYRELVENQIVPHIGREDDSEVADDRHRGLARNIADQWSHRR